MTFTELIKMGLFDAFWCFTNPIFNALVYIFVIIGIIIQTVCNRKAKKKIGRFVFPIILLAVCFLFECAASSMTGNELLNIEIYYCFAVYLLIGSVIALAVSLIRGRIRKGK